MILTYLNFSINIMNIKLLKIWMLFQNILDKRVNVLADGVNRLVDVMLLPICLTDALVLGKVLFCF